MAEAGIGNTARPKIDWNFFAEQARNRPKPVTYVQHEVVEDGYDKFRRISSKVARCRYDIPFGHSLIIAYSKVPGKSDPPHEIGAITFQIGDKTLGNPRKPYNFMDDYYHRVSFLFVDRDYQRIGVGSLLVNEALKSMTDSGIQRPVRLEGAKSAVKFFRKMGFISDGKPEVSFSRKGSRLFWEYYYMQRPAVPLLDMICSTSFK